MSEVNHPKHYNSNLSGVECITVVEHMTFNVGNAMKYLWRAGEKGKQVQDLQKAQWYITREIERLTKHEEAARLEAEPKGRGFVVQDQHDDQRRRKRP